MSTFTKRGDVTRCDLCKVETGHTWQAKRRHHWEHIEQRRAWQAKVS